MDKNLFSQLGMTDGEIEVYLAVVRIGQGSIGAIASEAAVSKSKIYDILERLIEKGLVGSIIKNGVRRFSANDPRMLIEYVHRKQEALDTVENSLRPIVEELTLARATAGTKRVAEIYEGYSGLRAIREELILTLKKGDAFLVLGAPKIANERWEGWLLDFHKRREKRGVGMRILFNSDARAYGKKRATYARTTVRYLPGSLNMPNWIDIYNDAILFGIILKEPMAIVIRDASLAQSFRSYFAIMWKNCVE